MSKRFKPKKEKKPKKPKKQTSDIQEVPPPKTCGEIHGTVCEKHGLPCSIPIEFHEGDDRAQWVAALHALGAKSHTKDDKHRCLECEKEQQEHSLWRFLKVEGSENNLPSSMDGADIRKHLDEMGWEV